MPHSDTRVCIVGCGSAGVTAAIGLARRGIPVVVVEGAPYTGGENWSGAVYFCENLARPEILGNERLRQTPLERRVVRRGLLMTDGRTAPGLSVRSHAAFNHCHTVLRPIFDHDLAEKARLFGAEILEGTTVTALIRDGDRVRGVLTDRGPIYADVVFLAEGDASNLVSREGLETLPPGAGGLAQPEFLQGVKEVLELPAREIERRFDLAPGEGAAYEALLRNGVMDGRPVRLNAGAFLYTNRESLSFGFVAPLKNLEELQGSHNRVMEWLKGLPALKPLLEGAQTVSYGAKVIRGGGFRQIPRLVLDGLAVGGAASGIGVDFPCPNYTGPATFMGWAFSEAVAEILEVDEGFEREVLERRYERRVRESPYFDDVRQLERWPEFVTSSREFFGRQVGLGAGLSHVLTTGSGPSRHLLAARLLFETLTPRRLGTFLKEWGRASRALGLLRGLPWDLAVMLPWWVVNTVAGVVPRRNRTGARLVPEHWCDGVHPRRPMPLLLRWLRWRLAPGLAEALHHLYRNDGVPLRERMRPLRRAILSRLALWDLVLLPVMGLITYLTGAVAAGWFRLSVALRKPSLDRILATAFMRQQEEARSLTDLGAVTETQDLDAKLALISYESEERTHIHFHAAYDSRGLPDNTGSSLFHVCPARVYEEEVDQSLSTSVAVLHENCVRCETCWRADDRHVDWGRTRAHKLVFEAYSSAQAWLLESREAASRADLARARDEAPGDVEGQPPAAADLPGSLRAELQEGLRRVAGHARAFLGLNSVEDAVLSGGDQWLLHELGTLVLDDVAALEIGLRSADDAGVLQRAHALEAWRRLAGTRLKARRFFHLEGDLEVLLQHHLADLAPRLDMELPPEPAGAHAGDAQRHALRAHLEARLDRETVAAAEEGLEPAPEVRQLLLRLAAELRDPDSGRPPRPGTPARDRLLEELARLSPSLAVLLARHLAFLDLLWHPDMEAGPRTVLRDLRKELGSGRLLGGLVERGFVQDTEGRLFGRLPGALLGGVQVLGVLVPEGLAVVGPGDPGVDVRVTGAIGLRAAGPGILELEGAPARTVFEGTRFGKHSRTRSAWDLVAVCRGMAGYLQERALDHAESRVQFPGLFKDLRGRDGVAKFGAVQEMLAGIARGVELLESLRGRVGHGLTAFLGAAEILGCSPRSVSYLAGQVLGGTAYSEEDPVCRLYRDASALTRMPYHTGACTAAHGERWAQALEPGRPVLPGLDLAIADVLEATPRAPVTRHTAPVRERLQALTRTLAGIGEQDLQACVLDVGRLALQVVLLEQLAARSRELLDAGCAEPVALGALESQARLVLARCGRLERRAAEATRVAALGRRLLEEDPLETPAGASGAAYSDYLGDGGTFRSGDLFLAPGGREELALTPELKEADTRLQTFDRQEEEAVRAAAAALADHRPYTRVVEAAHHVPLEDVQRLLDRGVFRMVIPEALGGGGRLKAEYYLSCTRMMRHADPAQAIIVMGSTSIGTTPILIGLDQDLPQARKDLGALLEKPGVVADIRAEVGRLLEKSRTPDVLKIGADMKALAARVREELQRSKAVRLVLQDFLAAFQDAGRAGLRRDLDGFREGLERAGAALEGWERRFREELRALPQREAAHEFYLRLIATGAVSAFALTEPSAGSDTARIRTRAEPAEVPASKDPRGFYTFQPEGSGETRNLFPYESFDFRDGRLHFIRADRTRVPVTLRHFTTGDEEGPPRQRYVELDGERVDIHDIGRVDLDGPRAVYRYYRVNGAKMWITNGSVAGVMILYARTSRGPSAFMLDAHAEGLVVGSDEHKMGQRGSATNELTLSDVRIPADQVIGIEGRGQENALETLNVGRAGLAVCSAGLMHEVVGDVRAGLEEGRIAGGAELPPWAWHELGRMALDLVGSESLSWQLVGRFDHPGTRSIRMESAMAKARSSEALHRVITRAERILDAEAALDLHELEKRRRDARVLTIYEGTNEVQRFLLLKDMLDVLDLDSLQAGPREGEAGATREVREVLDLCRRQVAGALEEVRGDLGARGWQAVHLQPWLFRLVDACTRCGVLGAVLHRSCLAGRLLPEDGAGGVRRRFLEEAAGLLAADLPRWDVTLFRELDLEGRRIREGRDLLAQSLADRALLRRSREEEPAGPPPACRFQRALRVVVVVDPQPFLGPRPRVAGGRLLEPHHVLADADREVLRQALALSRGGAVHLDVVGTCDVTGVDVLKEVLALGADGAFLLDTGGRNLLAADLAGAVADLLKAREEVAGAPYDLVLGSTGRAGLLLPLARRLGVDPVPGVTAFGVQEEAHGGLVARVQLAEEGAELELPAPALLLVDGEAGPADLRYRTAGWRRARRKAVAVIDYRPEGRTETRLQVAGAGTRSAAEEGPPPGSLDIQEVAARFAAEAGLAGSHEGPRAYEGPLETAGAGPFLEGADVLAVVEADPQGDLGAGAAQAAGAATLLAASRGGTGPGVLLLAATREEEPLRRAAGELLGAAPGARLGVVADPDLARSSLIPKSRLLEGLLEGFPGPVFLAWSLRQAGMLAGGARSAGAGEQALVDAIDHLALQNGSLVLGGAGLGGRVRFELERPVHDGGVRIVTRQELELELEEVSGREGAAVLLLEDVALERGADPLGDVLQAAAGRLAVEDLSEAEFIIDVGYGVGSRDGIEEVVEPLKEALQELGIRHVAVGATRKVTLDLGILPDSCQIGQTGVPVNPRVILALGVSGAPQHLDYIGSRAVIFAFNKDPEAPLMVLNRSRPRPLVIPVVGDLFETVPGFTEALKRMVGGG